MKKYGITRREWLAGASCLGLSMIPACATPKRLTLALLARSFFRVMQLKGYSA